jgi:hypothetical protein
VAPQAWSFYRTTNPGDDVWVELLSLAGDADAGIAAVKIEGGAIGVQEQHYVCAAGTIRGFSVTCDRATYHGLFATQLRKSGERGVILAVGKGAEASDEMIRRASERLIRLSAARPSVKYL